MADSEDFPKQTVLVLGAGGFVGSRLTKALTGSVEFRPIAGVRRPPSHSDETKRQGEGEPVGNQSDRRRSPGIVAGPDSPWPGVEIRVCDATNFASVVEALRDVDLVVNCVAGSNRAMVSATRILCDAARRAPPRRIVHLSSMAVYGDATGDVAEAAQPVLPLSPYGAAKLACEDIVHDYVRDGGDAVILRPGCIHGPGSPQWTLRLARLLQAGRIGDLGPAGDGTCNLVYIDDLVGAIMAALSAPLVSGKTFNISSPDSITWNEFLSRFARSIGATPVRRLSPRRITIERKLVAPALRLGSIAARLSRVPSSWMPEAITPSLAALWRQDIRLNTDEAQRHLDFHHTPLDRTLRESAQWLGAVSDVLDHGSPARRASAVELGRR